MTFRLIGILAVGLSLAACTTASTALEPIPGSLIYNGQPRTKLTKSPIGSTFTHRFLDPRGDRYLETYQLQEDRSVKLIARRKLNIFVGLGNDRDY
ncbi:hypothetical protein C8J34_10364 [Rhizobium sp. PP-F2F-G36]|nr:hypothetical protein C8J34_10364 [Rhizobium sp. PP-F2F-G36]